MTYTVKIQEDEDDDGSILQNRQFTNIDSELKSGTPTVSLQQTNNVGVTLNNITSFATTPIPSVSSSASIRAPISSVPLSASSVQQPANLPISSVQQPVTLPISTVQQTVSLPISLHQPVSVPISVQPSVSLNSYQYSRTSGSSITNDKQTKVSYVILPGSNTVTSSSVTTKLSNTPLGRLSSSFVSSSRNQQSLVNPNSLISTTLKTTTTLPLVLSTANQTNSTQVVAGTNASLTGIPIVSSNTNAVSSASILATSTSSSGGMIRVVAGGTTNRTLQPNNTKFTSIFNPSAGRLLATTGAVTTTPKLFPSTRRLRTRHPRLQPPKCRTWNCRHKIPKLNCFGSVRSGKPPCCGEEPRLHQLQLVTRHVSKLLPFMGDGAVALREKPNPRPCKESRRLRWAEHVAHMAESRNAYRVLVGRPEGKRPLGRTRRRWEDNIKMDLREVGYDDREWINLVNRIGPMADNHQPSILRNRQYQPVLCEGGNESSGSLKAICNVQSLTQEQLRQIATVLQQQHLESAPRTKNVVYDAETNTRIIYRVVYPEDLDLRDPRSPDSKAIGLGTGLGSGSSRGRGRRGRPPKSNLRGGLGRGVDGNSGRRVGVNAGSVDMDFDEDRLILDDTAKGERKKQLARTRSGRLSRPPRHMVKDYKRLHHLDFADADLDDSDGGYSDYQMSEHEAEETAEKTDSKELLPGLAVPKRKISSHFRCPTCQKIYLGYSRMSRHFEMYPDHGNIEQLQMPNRTNNSNNTTSNSNNNNNNNNIGERERPSTESTNTPKLGMTFNSTALNGVVRTGPGRRRGKRRGPWAYTTPEARSQRRKGKLREVLVTCEANELAEVAGPAVAGVVSLWDLMLMRVEAVRTEESYVVTLFEELQALLEKVRAVASEILKPLADVKEDSKEHQFELQDELLCTTLGLASGTYLVDDRKLQQHINGGREPPDEPSLKRMKMDDEELENEGTKSGIVNHDATEECGVNSEDREKDEVTKGEETDCPEVLSALTLVAKSTLGQVSERDPSLIPARTSGDDGSKVVGSEVKSDDFLLSGESNDLCVKLTSGGDGDGDTRLQQTDHQPEFSSSEQHTQDLQTVDDIVNERLKNLTSGSSLVDFSVATPMNVVSSCMTTSAIDIPKPSLVSSQDLIDRLGQFTSSAVSSFDPEMALAAMGEGEQDSVSASNQHFQSMETVPSDSGSSFDPEVALAAMGEGEQSSSVEPQRAQFQQMEGVPSRSTFNPEDALVAMGEGEQTDTQFQNSLPQIGSRPAFDPEMALAAMGEGEQVTSSTAPENQFQSSLPQIRMDDEISGNSGTPFDLAAMGEGDRSDMQTAFSTTANTSSNAGRTFSVGIGLGDIGDSENSKSSSHCPENVSNVTRFDHEMALAASTMAASESTHIPYQSPIPQSSVRRTWFLVRPRHGPGYNRRGRICADFNIITEIAYRSSNREHGLLPTAVCTRVESGGHEHGCESGRV
ncbi:hypothetical protein ANN_20230 [Periplaneta americana]|uniref:DUF4764 domain-containing protein n=1 Tax=Periplaneta americana TaxID=6978 RepID=A0ABQ8SD76_PERAM|nr:hypothetical protein ANN_20230 [Periplaneta americana]